MPNQNIQDINISDLYLWTENPRDPVSTTSSDYEIISRALEGNPKDWNLDKLLKEMGDYYDYSELPTVVFIDEKPLVFDGNRRIALIKCLQNPGLYSAIAGKLFPSKYPQELVSLKVIPCNVCDKQTALNNIERKHVNSGSWGTLQREYFSYLHRGQSKSFFLILEDQAEFISSYPILNQRFVKDEVLTPKNLQEIGFSLDGEKLVSIYTVEQQHELFAKIASLISKGDISTRKNRGVSLKKVLLEIYPELNGTIFEFDASKPIEPVIPRNGATPQQSLISDTESHGSDEEDYGDNSSKSRRTATTSPSDEIFGRKLFLEKGPVNDLYTAITDIYERFSEKENVLPIIGMSLRLILDVAGRIHFERVGQAAQANDDGVSGRFIKEAKKELKDSLPLNTKNAAALTLDWISDSTNLAGIVHKFAHGSVDNSKRTIVQTSVVVGDILEHYFKRE